MGLSFHNLILRLVDFPSEDRVSSGVVKRELDGIPESVVPSQFTVKPIIPGVTVPWSHLPVLLLALFLAQCIHEAGHAISAGLENLPLHSVGFSLTLALPSAFVALPPSLHQLKHAARQRIIAAGAWHNLVLWASIYIVSFLSANAFWTTIGWRDISDVGRVVLSVEADSPLRAHLQSGNIIYALDDTQLSIPNPSGHDTWEEFLLADDNPDHPLQKGWCVQKDWYQNQSTSCCSRMSEKFEPSTAYLTCFAPFPGDRSLEDGHCVNPVPILTPNDQDPPAARCSQVHDCDASMQCVAPDVGAHLTRISVGPPIWQEKDHDPAQTKTVLWSGPKSEIWDEVSLGVLAPRSSLVPIFLPRLVSLFFEYLATLSLSLYLFNLFCLPFLDGSLFFSALLDSIGGAREPDESMSPIELSDPSDHWLEGEYEGRYSLDTDLESGSDELTRRYSPPPLHNNSRGLLHTISHSARRFRWGIRSRKRTIEFVVRVGTIGLIGFVILGMVWTQQWKATEM